MTNSKLITAVEALEWPYVRCEDVIALIRQHESAGVDEAVLQQKVVKELIYSFEADAYDARCISRQIMRIFRPHIRTQPAAAPGAITEQVGDLTQLLMQTIEPFMDSYMIMQGQLLEAALAIQAVLPKRESGIDKSQPAAMSEEGAEVENIFHELADMAKKINSESLSDLAERGLAALSHPLTDAEREGLVEAMREAFRDSYAFGRDDDHINKAESQAFAAILSAIEQNGFTISRKG